MANFKVFCGRRVGLMASFKLPSAFYGRRFSGGLVEEPGSDGSPVPAWMYWKKQAEQGKEIWKKQAELWKKQAELWEQKLEFLQYRVDREAKHWEQKLEFLQYRVDREAKQYRVSLGEASLEILEHKYHFKARGIPELFFKSLTRDARMHCLTKAADRSLSDVERKLYNALSSSWFPQARKEIWKVVYELPVMHEFKNDMQKLLAAEDPELLVEKTTILHKEFHHCHHSGVRERQTIIFVREHLQQGIQDVTVDSDHLEGFLKAMAKTIYVNVAFVNQSDVVEEADD